MRRPTAARILDALSDVMTCGIVIAFLMWLMVAGPA
jgi:hypothetical protein